jgi:hypothetical protein
MKRELNHLLVLLVLCSSVCAQETGNEASPSKLDEYMETGMEVAGVRAPYYDDEGNLKAELFGAHAKILEGGIAEVTNIRIDVFEQGVVFMTVFAPKCYTQVVEQGEEKFLSVESEGDVLIDMEQMTIAGRGFLFTSENNRFEILSEAKVLVKEAAQNMKGLER